MRNVKSERLKKFEAELKDLEQWLKLGLVPKKDIEKHKEEIEAVRAKIDEEKERLQFLKESGDAEDFMQPKRTNTGRTSYTELPSLPDVDINESGAGDSQFEMDSEGDASAENSVIADRDDQETDTATDDDDMEDEESYFSDKNRWRRGGIIDPDADEW